MGLSPLNINYTVELINLITGYRLIQATEVIMPKYLPEVDFYTNILNNGTLDAHFILITMQSLSLKYCLKDFVYLQL